MFKYNQKTSRLEDLDRSLVLITNGGSSELKKYILIGKEWKMDILVVSENNRYQFFEKDLIENHNYHVTLHISCSLAEGAYNLEQNPEELAREAIVENQIQFYSTDPTRITIV